MQSVIYHALASADINQLLSEAAQVVADAFSADHVLVLELGAIDSQSCFCAGVGWDKSTSVRLGKRLLAEAQQPHSTDLEQAGNGEGPLQGGIYRPSPAFLEEYQLQTGLFIVVPCGRGLLGLFAGDSRGGELLSAESGARSLYTSVVMLGMAVGRASNELERSASLQQVVEAKQQWETTLDALPQLVCLIDEKGIVIRANRTLETWQLGEVSSIRGTPVHAMLHPDCSDPDCSLIAQLEQMSRQLDDAQFAECTLHDLSPGGESHISLFRGDSSRYGDSTTGKGFAFLVIEDVSQQKYQERLLVDYNRELENQLQKQSVQIKAANTRLETAIREHMRDKLILGESEKRYACFVENTLTGIYVVKNNQLVFYNRRFAEIFGYDRDYIYRLGPHELFPEDGQWAVSAQMAATNAMDEDNVVRGTARGGQSIWLRRSLRSIDCSSEPMLLGSIVDVTEQKHAEDRLRRSERELGDLSEKLLLAQEVERKRIALELHDGIGQSLSAIKFVVENALQECRVNNAQQNGEYLADIVSKLRDAIKEVRNISMGLRPSMLDDLGLVATSGWFCREFQSLYPTLRVRKQIDIDESAMPDALKIVIFRILQEAFNNIGKHAAASSVSVELRQTADTLLLRIEDDGRGIPPEVFRAARGLGLGSMKERAKLSSGNFIIDTAPGKGTVVQVVWPLPGGRLND